MNVEKSDTLAPLIKEMRRHESDDAGSTTHSHLGQSFGHLAAKADGTTCDDGDAPVEIEQLPGVHDFGKLLARRFGFAQSDSQYHNRATNVNLHCVSIRSLRVDA